MSSTRSEQEQYINDLEQLISRASKNMHDVHQLLLITYLDPKDRDTFAKVIRNAKGKAGMTTLQQIEQENQRLRQFVEKCREAYSELEYGSFVAGLTFQANIKDALAAITDSIKPKGH